MHRDKGQYGQVLQKPAKRIKPEARRQQPQRQGIAADQRQLRQPDGTWRQIAQQCQSLHKVGQPSNPCQQHRDVRGQRQQWSKARGRREQTQGRRGKPQHGQHPLDEGLEQI
jgi:hypothetical protein